MCQFFASGGQSIGASFSFSISASNEYSGLISFRMDWFGLLAVQETLKSLLQHHISKASILWRSAFFIVQLSHPYMTTGKTIALTRWIFSQPVHFISQDWSEGASHGLINIIISEKKSLKIFEFLDIMPI